MQRIERPSHFSRYVLRSSKCSSRLCAILYMTMVWLGETARQKSTLCRCDGQLGKYKAAEFQHRRTGRLELSTVPDVLTMLLNQ